MSDVKVSLEHFEGPLALLLYLIRKEEMDIMNINIVQITDQYLNFVKKMQTLDLELAGDFIAMAATLIQIKSRMLMPKELLTEDEEIDLEESKSELLKRLREYKLFQEASKKIYESSLLGRDVWSKGFREKNFKRPDDVVKVEDNPLYALITHYKKALKGVKKTVHRVGIKLQSIASRVMEIKTHLAGQLKTTLLSLADLPSDFTTDYRSRLLITFLSTLELSKMGFVRLTQTGTYSDIHLNVTGDLDGDVVSQVEDYESLNHELQTELFMDSKVEISDGTEFFEDTDKDQEDEVENIDDRVNDDTLSFLNQDENNSDVVNPDLATDEEIEAAEKELEGDSL